MILMPDHRRMRQRQLSSLVVQPLSASSGSLYFRFLTTWLTLLLEGPQQMAPGSNTESLPAKGQRRQR